MEKIRVVTIHTPHIAYYSQYTLPLIKEYCDRWGYEYVEYTSSLDLSRHIRWSKWKAVERNLSDGVTVLWVDADCCPINHRLPLNIYLDGRDHDIIMDSESPTTNAEMLVSFNTGLFFVRPTDWSRNFIKTFYADPAFTMHHNGDSAYHDQSGFIMAVLRYYHSHNTPKHICKLPQYTMHSFTDYSKHFVHNYGPGKFLLNSYMLTKVIR